MNPIKIAVVGYGRFGAKHAHRLREHPAFQVVGVVDPCPQAREQAERENLACFDSLDGLPESVRAATVVTPPNSHASVTQELMERGIDVLVEKPLASSRADILAMLHAARVQGQHLIAGHIERFNPCFESGVPWQAAPTSIKFERSSRRTGSIDDLALDLMVHDLDLAAHLLAIPRDEKIRVISVAADVHYLSATIELGNTRVDLNCSYSADKSGASLSWSDARGPAQSELELSAQGKPGVTDALTRQFNAFHARICGQSSKAATGEDGAAAVFRALDVLASL